MARALIPLKVASGWLAIEAASVREILGERPVVLIPGGSALLPGVVAWRGRAVAMLDLGGGGLEVRGTLRGRTLIVEASGSMFAIAVEAVREVAEVESSAVRPAHVTRHAHATTEVELRGEPVPILDLASLVRGALSSGQ